jgi:hypothetical protein
MKKTEHRFAVLYRRMQTEKHIFARANFGLIDVNDLEGAMQW